MKTLLQFLIVRPALAALAFTRQHPWIALLILLFFVAVALLWQTAVWANSAMAKIRKIVAWFDASTVRTVALYVALAIVPGSFVLWLLMRIAKWWSDRPVKVETTAEEGQPVWQPAAPTTAQGGFA